MLSQNLRLKSWTKREIIIKFTMVEIKDPVIIEREKDFVADHITFINFVETYYRNPIAPEPRVYAEEEYDNITKELVQKERIKLREEGLKLGLPSETLGTYITPKLLSLRQDRNNKKDDIVEQRTNELVTEIPEGMKKLKSLEPLFSTIDDGTRIQDFMI